MREGNRLYIRLGHDLLERVRAAALAEGLTVSAWIRRLILKALGLAD